MAKGKASNVIVWIILVLLIIGLAGFGVTNFGGGVQAVGRVGDREIDIDRYARALQTELRALSAGEGRTVPLLEAEARGVPQSVLGRLVGEAALEAEAEALGLSVGDETVRAQILAIPAFQGVDGAFDREAYRFVLEQNGLSVGEFEEQIRTETAAGLIRQAVVAGTVFPDVFADRLYAHAREARTASWARIGPDALETVVPEPDAAALRAFHEANPERFTAPETRVVTYAWLTPDMIVDTIAPDEAALRAVYEDRIADYVQPERRLVERLVFATEAAAAEALARIGAGEADFDALVDDRGLELADVDLGDVTEAELGEAGAAVFALETPGLAGPAPTPLGPALFRVNAILAPRDVSFEEAREDLLPEVQMDRARRLILDMVDDLDDRLAGGATVEDLAEETELELGRIDLEPGTSEGIAAYESFREAAAAAEPGDFAEIVEIPEGGVFALRLDELRPPALRPFEEVQGAVREAWLAAETARLMAEEAQSLADDLAADADIAALGLPSGTERGLVRDAFVEGLPAGFVPTLFEMAEGEVRVVADETGAWIVRLDRISPADPGSAEARALKALLGDQTAQEAADDLLQAFTGALAAQSGVEINQAAINAVHAQFP